MSSYTSPSYSCWSLHQPSFCLSPVPWPAAQSLLALPYRLTVCRQAVIPTTSYKQETIDAHCIGLSLSYDQGHCLGIVDSDNLSSKLEPSERVQRRNYI